MYDLEISDLDLGIFSSLLDSGSMGLFYENNLTTEMLLGDDSKAIFQFIDSYWKEHGKTPPREYISFHKNCHIIPTAVPFSQWCNDLKNRYLFDSLSKEFVPISQMIHKDPKAALEKIMEIALRYTAETSPNKPVSFFANADRKIQDYFSAQKGMMGVPSPWSTLNKNVMGWQPGELILFAARPGRGKTWFLLLMAMHAWRSGYKALVISPEMSEIQMIRRMDSLIQRISYKGIKTGGLSNQTQEQFIENVKEQERSDNQRLLLFSQPETNIDVVDALVIQYKPQVIFIDSVYHLNVAGRFYRDFEKNAELFRQLKKLATRRGIPLIGTTQLNKSDGAGEDQSKKMAFSDVANQISDYIFFLNQTKEQKDERLMEIEPTKLRDSEYMDKFVIHWKFDMHKFNESTVDEAVNMNFPSPRDLDVNILPPDEPWNG